MTVEQEVLNAYADCGLLEEATKINFPQLYMVDGKISDDDSKRYGILEDEYMKLRDLQFRASESVSALYAYQLMKRACESYNHFDCELLKLFPDDCQITIAREGSVCLYVQKGDKKLPTINKLKASEYDLLKEDHRFKCQRWNDWDSGSGEEYGGFKGEVRIWWD